MSRAAGPHVRPPRTGRSALLGLAATVLLLATPPGGASTSTAHRAPSLTLATPYIQHVVTIVLENEVLANVWHHGPYERWLASIYGNASDVFAACHPSAPNYLDMVAAVANQCGSDNWTNDTNTTIGDLMLRANLTYGSFAEGLPKTACSSPGTATSGLFAVKHVPFLYFRDVLVNQTFCHAHVAPARAFTADIANGTLPNYTFYTPNLCDDGHNGCGGNTTSAQETAQADAWLQGFLTPILNHTGPFQAAAALKLIAHTLFIITWDEGLGNNSGYPVNGTAGTYNRMWCQRNHAPGDAVCGGPVYTAFVSPYSLGRSYRGPASDVNLVRTVEWLFHLPHLNNTANLDAKPGFPVMKSLFSFTSNS